MKKLLKLAVVVGTLVAVNAALESQKECQCYDDCWCKTEVGRHFRWIVPRWHKGPWETG